MKPKQSSRSLPSSIADVVRIGIRLGGVRFGLISAIELVSGAMPAASAWFLKTLFDHLANRGADIDLGRVTWLALLYVSVLLVATTLDLVVSPLRGDLARRIELEMRSRVHHAVGTYPLLDVFDSPSTYDLIHTGTAAAMRQPSIALAIGTGSVRMLSSIASFGLLAISITPVLGLGVGAVALARVFAVTRTNRIRDEQMVRAAKHARRADHISEIIVSPRHAPEIRAFSYGSPLTARFRDALSRAHDTQSVAERREAAVMALPSLAELSVTAALLIWMGRGVAAGDYTIGDITFTLSALAALQGTATMFIGNLETIDYVRRLQRHVGRLVARLAPGRDSPTSDPHSHSLGSIELRDLTFSYCDGPHVLDGVDLRIERGEKIGLVGRNGSGKTTLVKLIAGLYLPSKGEVLWDGRPTLELDVSQRLSVFSSVFQDIARFDVTLRDYLTMGHRNAADDSDLVVLESMASAGCSDLVASLPRGADTVLSREFAQTDSDPGVELSGGQWQRLAIARMFAAGGDVLLLDEPTASADLEYERMLAQRLAESTKTVVIATHRPQLLRIADRVIVLDKGRIAQQGSPDELYARSGLFAHLFGDMPIDSRHISQDDVL